MRKVILIAIAITFVIFLMALYKKRGVSQSDILAPTPPNIVHQDYKAEFKIITNGTTRIFTDSKYHRLSPEVYIDPKDTNAIVITKLGITWADFFKTLPMSLDKKCLTTGTKQTFCTNSNQALRFFVNGVEDLDALDKAIKDKDSLVVTFD